MGLDATVVATLPAVEDSVSSNKSVKKCLNKTSQWAKNKTSDCFSIDTVKSVLPLFRWLPKYRLPNIGHDVIAGVTVGLTAIPQSMGYASVAGLPPQYGLYSSFMGCFMYFIFGSTIPANIGPTAIMALLTNDHASRGGPAGAVLLCFLTGCVTLGFGILNLGFLIDFISSPVISGFSSAAAIIISSTQLKGLLGIDIKDESIIGVIKAVIKQFSEINYWDLILGIICLILLLLLRRLGSIKWKDEAPSMAAQVFQKFVWLLSAGRNVIIVITASILIFFLESHEKNPFTLTGDIPPGLPGFKLPAFELYDSKKNETLSFTECLKDFNTSLLLVPLLAILEHIAISKIFTRGKSLDATQELIALGVGNIMGAFVSSFPTTGSFSRTALNADCGVKSPIAGVFTGAVVILALTLLTPSFHFIPKPTLSAVIITAVIFMVEIRLLPHLWKTKKFCLNQISFQSKVFQSLIPTCLFTETDLAVMVVTFFACLGFGVEYGILIGITFSMIVLLYNTARPKITIDAITLAKKKYIFLQPDRMLNFPSVEYLRHRINKSTKAHGKLPVILDGIYLCGMDYTVIQCVKELLDEFQEQDQLLIFINLKAKVVEKIKILEPKTFHYYADLQELEASMLGDFQTPIPGLTDVRTEVSLPSNLNSMNNVLNGNVLHSIPNSLTLNDKSSPVSQTIQNQNSETDANKNDTSPPSHVGDSKL